MRVAAIQMCSTPDLEANLAAADKLVAEAAERGAGFIALPENFPYLRREGQPNPTAQGLEDEIVTRVRGWAREHGAWILGGTFAERSGGGDRVFNTSVLVSAAGEVAAVYRKMHLFDVDLTAAGGAAYQESATIAPGDEIVVADTPFGGVGLSVCYDLRFPELYREHAKRGARFLMVPAAFAPQTGKDHWRLLLRARAIENLAYVVAPAQWGRHTEDRASHGRAAIIDPWGVVLAEAPDRPCVLVADCSPEHQDRVRASLPALGHRRIF